MNISKTGNLRLDTSDLEITITGHLDEQGKPYFRATDQHGNTDVSRRPERAEIYVRAKVDVQR